MCLEILKDQKKARGNFRWKVVNFKRRGGYLVLASPYMGTPYKQTGNKARLNAIPEEEGFHVFVNKEDAEGLARRLSYNRHCYVKVRVRGFLKAGEFRCDICETWREFDIVGPLHGEDSTIVKGKIRK